MYSENSGKSKDAQPLETVQRIRTILAQMGIFVTETWFESVEGIFSVQLISEKTGLFANGKGTSKEYALASGYAEYMERLQNGVLYRYKTVIAPNDRQYNGFIYAPDEKYLSFDELLETPCKSVTVSLINNSGLTNFEMLKAWAEVDGYATDDKLLALPFYNVFQDKVEHIPVIMLDRKYGSNGMCAGNTPQEAMVQGLSEIMERYVNFKILEGNITPPTIPDEILKSHPTLQRMKEKIEASGDYKLILKDCSLGEGIPVVGTILINKKDLTYFIKFASHPRFEIAIERTLTELLQGRNIRKMNGMSEFHFILPEYDNVQNKLKIFTLGEGYYPEEFFKEQATYPLSISMGGIDYTNNQMLEFFLTFIKDKGYDALIRDVSFLGFPSYYIIIPGISEFLSCNDWCLSNAKNAKSLQATLMNILDAEDADIQNVLDILASQGWSDDAQMSDVIPIKMQKNFSWHWIYYGFFKSCAYIKLRRYDKAAEALYKYIDILKEKTPKLLPLVPYYRCIAHLLEALHTGCTIEYTLEILKIFHPQNVINEAVQALETPFASLVPFSCFNCNECKYNKECNYSEISSFHCKWKDVYKENNVKQDGLRYILKYNL